MIFQRIRALIVPNLKRMIVSKQSFWVYVIVGTFVLIDLGLGWNGRGVTLFFVPIESCCSLKESALLSILHEHFSWLWLFIAFVFVLPQLLSPLGDSFLVSHVLWLRLTPCSPYEVAIARAASVIFCSVWLGALGFFWVLINSFVHQVSLIKLLVDVEGIVSYILLAGGIVTALDFGLAIDYSGRRFIATFALLAPFLLLLVFTLMGDTKYSNYFPYTVPFITGAPTYTQLSVAIPSHFGAAAVLGILLLCLHILSKLQYSSLKAEVAGEN